MDGMKTIRLDLGEGNHAVFFLETLHRTQKAVNLLTRPFLQYPGGAPPKLELKEGEKPKVVGTTTVEVDMSKLDFDAVNDAIIIGQVKEWTFGPVNQDTLDGLPESVREALKDECNRLYGSSGPLPKGGGVN